MFKPEDETGGDSRLPPDASPMEIKIEPEDALFGPASGRDFERVSGRNAPSGLGRVLRFGGLAVVVALLCGAAFAAGAHSSGRLPLHVLKAIWGSGAPQSAQREDIARTMAQMTDEIHALKASLDAREAQAPGAAPAASGATIADIAGRLDRLQADIASRLAKVDQQLASIEQQVSASHSAAAVRAPPHIKRAEHAEHAEHTHDAFDPNQHPAAIGAPRPLGTCQGAGC